MRRGGNFLRQTDAAITDFMLSNQIEVARLSLPFADVLRPSPRTFFTTARVCLVGPPEHGPRPPARALLPFAGRRKRIPPRARESEHQVNPPPSREFVFVAWARGTRTRKEAQRGDAAAPSSPTKHAPCSNGPISPADGPARLFLPIALARVLERVLRPAGTSAGTVSTESRAPADVTAILKDFAAPESRKA